MLVHVQNEIHQRHQYIHGAALSRRRNGLERAPPLVS